MDWLFFYLMGSILAFGLSCSASWSRPLRESELSKGNLILLGTVMSWITVLAFVYGVLRGICGIPEE